MAMDVDGGSGLRSKGLVICFHLVRLPSRLKKTEVPLLSPVVPCCSVLVLGRTSTAKVNNATL
jgi:hypothetical protein